MIFTTGLMIYHFELIRKNLTTKEELKNVYKEPLGNPFYRSFLNNFKQALCPTLPKFSLLDRMRAKITRKRQPLKIVNLFLNLVC
jgi:hypothetical protein